nr:hypothetical protein [Tanacetum cinerariifolium]
MQKRRNDVKARTTLLLALPDEHQLRFSKYKTAQELWAAILKRFGGNEATKKTKKNLLKQQYGNFKAECSETLEQTFNRLQVIPEWLMHTFVWRNRSDLDTMSLDDLYNHLKVYEPEVQKKSESNSQNMAFISSAKNCSGNEEVNTASIPTASTQVSPAGPNVVTASISLDNACAYIASQSNGSQIKYEDINQIDENDIEEMDIKWNMALLSMRADRFWKKIGKKISIQGSVGLPEAKTREGETTTDNEENHALVADEEALTEFTLMAKISAESEVFDNSLCSKACKKNTDSLNSKITELSKKLGDTKNILYHYKLGFKSASKDLDNLLESQRSNKNKEGLGYSVVPPPPAQVYSPSKKDMSWTRLLESADDTITDYSRPSPAIKSNLDALQNRKPSVAETGASSSTILSKPAIKFVKAADRQTESKIDKVETVKKPVVQYAKLYRKTTKKSNGNSHNYINDKGYWDSGCSRHMTGNMSYLSDYEPFDGGYVSFGTKEAASQDVKKDMSSLRYIPLPNWFHEAHLETSTNSPEPSSTTRIISKRVTSQDVTPSLDNISTLANRFEDIVRVTTSSSDTHGVEVDSLVDCPKGVRPIGTKWVLKNKKDERGIVIKNKARLVAQGHTQEEEVDYDEVFALVARIEAIRLFLAYALFMGFTVYQMDVNSAFLYGKDKTGKDVDLHMYRSIIGSLMYLTASRPDIMFAICVYARHQVTPKEFHLHAVKRIFRYLKGHPKLGIWYPKDSPFDLIIMATSTTEAEYIAAASGCGQVLWIQNQLLDYGEIPVEHAMRGSVLGNYIIYTAIFWSTARIKKKDEGTKILATINGKPRTISESSIRRNLKLKDKAGISSLPDAELFENLTLMGYNISPNQKFTFQKGRTVPLFPTMLVSMGEGSGTLIEPHHTPSPEAQQTSLTTHSSPLLPPVTTEPLPTVIPSDTPQLRQYTRRARISQSSALPPVADEPASPAGDDRQRWRRYCTIWRRCPNQGESLGKVEEEGIERSTEKGSNDTEEMVNVLTSLDAATVLSSGVSISISPITEVSVAEVLTGSGSIPTASPPGTGVPTGGVPTGSGVIPTASPIFTTATVATPYTRRKGKEKMVESETPKKKKLQEQMDVQMARQLEEEMERDAQRMNEQIARDAKIARILAEEELQIMIDGLDRNNETVAKYLQEYYQFAAELPIGERIELIKESERFKRKWIRLEQDGAKKLKTLEEVSEEDLKDMMQLVPVEEVYVEALQVKHPIIDWEVHTEGERSYWKIIRLGGSTASYQFFVDMLKHFNREDLNQLWALVKETLNIKQAANDKEKELWVELKRLYEPDVEDQLWTHT